MQFSKYALEHMGYTEYPEDDILNIIFHCLIVCEIEGVNIEDQIDLKIFKLGINCDVVITNHLNDGVKHLTNQNFTDNEEKWVKDKNAIKPFLLIFFKENLTTQLKGGYRQKYEDIIMTHNAFEGEMKEIKTWRLEQLPKIITSIVLNFSSYSQEVVIKPIDEKIFGLTTDGTYLEDFNFRISANLTQSFNVSLDNIEKMMLETERSYQNIPDNLAHNFYVFLNEKDNFKRFLGFFQIIEKFTHLCFKKIKYDNDVVDLIKIANGVETHGYAHLKGFFEQSKNLRSRFIWCALTIWKDIDDSDIDKFLEIKKIRDKISHGEDVAMKDINSSEAKRLTIKLLQQWQYFDYFK